ncbi:hypothetical protein [Algibacillus agarilyticus]|uniref:hypothetical protein n=1 Tax=Algibacillus agarilyticus TaxID=2234133 RepID=UPI000DCFEDF7|nr:hypothetical protein [Algibacillus agarilyticus]
MLDNIEKKHLVTVLKDCIEGRLTPAEVQDWMVDNYDPLEIKIAENEPDYTQEAMNIVMNEYELVDLNKCLPIGFEYALAFVCCQEHEYAQARANFIKAGFID